MEFGIYIDEAIKKLEIAKKRITEAFKAEAMTLQEFRKEKTDIELSEEKLISERDGLTNKLNIQHNIEAKIDLFKETCHKFLSKINDPKIVTNRVKKDIIKLIIDEVVIDGEKLKIAATIPLPNKVHEREIVKADTPDTFNSGATLGPINQTKMERIWTKHKEINTTLKPKVFVAMSGGVDSSVAAALLKEEGWDVVGVFMHFWSATQTNADYTQIFAKNVGISPRKVRDSQHIRENKCCSIEAYRDALAVADKLGIKLYTFNFEKEFKKRVVDYFIKSLKRGETPNPCVVCNREIKFKLLFEKILKLGGDYVATGHYAKNQKSKIKNQNDKSKFKIINKLFKARDKNKDQSYFLWTVKQKQLAKFLFPIGDYKKDKVRKIAKDFGLPVFQKRDSEDLCFVGDHLGGFISHYVKPRAGDIIEIGGKKLGEHNGLPFYTIGQRKNIGLSGGPWYVYKKNMAKNQLIVVGEQNKNLLFGSRVLVEDVSWIAGVSPKFPCEAMVKIRYQHNGAKATIIKNGNHYIVEFNKPQLAITPGQSAVFYKGAELLGGGVIL